MLIIKTFALKSAVILTAAALLFLNPINVAFAADGSTDIEALEVRQAVSRMVKPANSSALNSIQAVPVWPAGGTDMITSSYGYRVHPIFGTIRFHYGLDIGVDQGTPVVSPLAGTVYSISWSDAVGNVVEINHGDGIITRYCHLSLFLASVGQPLAQGQVFALSGGTGYLSTGPHLHFEVYDLINSNNNYVDPYYTFQREYTVDPQVWLTYTPVPPTPALPPDYGRSLLIKDTLAGSMTRILSATAADPAFSPNEAWRSGLGAFDGNRAKMTAGDFNSDGFADVAMLYDYGGARSGLLIFLWNIDEYVLYNAWMSEDGSWDTNRSRIVSGDFAGDGKTDVAVLYDYGGGTSGLWLFTTVINGSSVYSVPSNAWISGAGCFETRHAQLSGGDFAGDGKADVAVMYDYGGATSAFWVFANSGGSMTPGLSWVSGLGGWDPARSKIVAGQFIGDAKSDLAVLYDYGSSTSAVWTFTATAGGLAPNRMWYSGASSWDASRSKVAAGNFGGDANSDIAILYDYGNSSAAIWTLVTAGDKMDPVFEWASPTGGFDSSRMKLDGS